MCVPADSSHPWVCSIPRPRLAVISLTICLGLDCSWCLRDGFGDWQSGQPGTMDRVGETWGRIGTGHPYSVHVFSVCEGLEDRAARLPKLQVCVLCSLGAESMSQRPAKVYPGPPYPTSSDTTGQAMLFRVGSGPYWPPAIHRLKQEWRGPEWARPGCEEGALAPAPCCNAVLLATAAVIG